MITILLVSYWFWFELQLFVKCKNVKRLVYSLNYIDKVYGSLNKILFFKNMFIFWSVKYALNEINRWISLGTFFEYVS